jgi:tetratricopeptide (TPR) repeat protein
MLAVSELLLVVGALLFGVATVIWPILSVVVDFARKQVLLALTITAFAVGASTAALIIRRLREALLRLTRSRLGQKLLLGLVALLVALNIAGLFYARGTVIVVGNFSLSGEMAGNSVIEEQTEMIRTQLFDTLSKLDRQKFAGRYPVMLSIRELSLATIAGVLEDGLTTYKLAKLKRQALGVSGALRRYGEDNVLELHMIADSILGRWPDSAVINGKTLEEIVAGGTAKVLNAVGLRISREDVDAVVVGDKLRELSEGWKIEADFAREAEAQGLLAEQSHLSKIRQYEELVAKNPSGGTYRYYLAIAYLQAGFQTEGEQALKAALLLNKELAPGILFQFGRHMYYAGNFEKAKEAYKSFVDMQPGSLEGRDRLGVATWRTAMQKAQREPRQYFNRKHFGERIKEAEELLKSARKYPPARFHLAQLYTHIGEFEKADDLYKDAIDLLGGLRKDAYLYGFADSLRERGEFVVARKYYEKALEIHAVNARGECESRKGGYFFFEVVVNSMIVCLTSDYYHSNVGILATYYQNLIDGERDEKGRIDQASQGATVLKEIKRKLSQRGVRIHPHTRSHLLDVLGYALFIRGDMKEAREELAASLQLESDQRFAIWVGYPRYHFTLWLLKNKGSRGDLGDALKYLSEANLISIEGSWLRRKTAMLMEELKKEGGP